MREPAHLAPRPFASPYNAPKGSRLEKFLHECDLGIFEAYDTTLYETTLTEDFRDYFLKRLHREGLAFDLLDPSHSAYFEMLLQAERSFTKHWLEVHGRGPSGNPGPDYLMALIALAAFICRLGEGVSMTAAFRAAAEDLGPGVRADHVKRAALAALREGCKAQRADGLRDPKWARLVGHAHNLAEEITLKSWHQFQRASGRLLSHADGF
ncbi:MAG: hypothetical protein VX874_17675 [Pseudomonadota bacterium]|nr:hypothetical protein [Pseudomonadota bacterium]